MFSSECILNVRRAQSLASALTCFHAKHRIEQQRHKLEVETARRRVREIKHQCVVDAIKTGVFIRLSCWFLPLAKNYIVVNLFFLIQLHEKTNNTHTHTHARALVRHTQTTAHLRFLSLKYHVALFYCLFAL